MKGLFQDIEYFWTIHDKDWWYVVIPILIISYVLYLLVVLVEAVRKS